MYICEFLNVCTEQEESVPFNLEGSKSTYLCCPPHGSSEISTRFHPSPPCPKLPNGSNQNGGALGGETAVSQKWQNWQNLSERKCGILQFPFCPKRLNCTEPPCEWQIRRYPKVDKTCQIFCQQLEVAHRLQSRALVSAVYEGWAGDRNAQKSSHFFWFPW